MPTAISRRHRPIPSARPSTSPASPFSAPFKAAPRARQQAVSGGEQSVPSARGARAACGCRLPLQRRHDRESRVPSRRLTRFRRSRISWPAPTTTRALRRRSARPRSTQTNPNRRRVRAGRVEGEPELTVNAGLRYDLQFLETIKTDTNNVSPRLGFAWSPSASGRTIVRGSAGLFYDRVPLRALANALLSAGNTTDLTKLRRVSVSLSPTQDGAPAFPNILSASVLDGDAGQPDDDGSEHEERILQAGERRGGAAARAAEHGQRRLSVPARRESDHGGESERADVRGGRCQQRLPSEPELREQQPVFACGELQRITACTCRSCSGRPSGDITGCRTRSRSR